MKEVFAVLIVSFILICTRTASFDGCSIVIVVI